MKFYKTILRLWIALISSLGFVAGWVFLAHSPKPQPIISTNANSASTASLAPVPTLNDLLGNGSSNSNDFAVLQSSPNTSRSFTPRFRTGGS